MDGTTSQLIAAHNIRSSPVQVLTRMRVPSIAVLALGAATFGGAMAQSFVVQGGCRDGLSHGAWQLTDSSGRLRGLGAFNRGKRTGSFIYWNASGVRIAHMPYEEDARNGTLALWYQTPINGLDAQQRLEAVYSAGRLNGVIRIWNPDGRARGEYLYADGQLVAAKAWDGRGRELSEQQARAQAEKDVSAHEAYHQTLEALVARHQPVCDSAAPPKPG